MNKYKYTSLSNNSVLKIYENPIYNIGIVKDGNGWEDFKEYLASGGQVDPFKTEEELKTDALNESFKNIKKTKDEYNLKDFEYNGNFYISDRENIQGVQNDCLASDPNNPILTFLGTEYEGKWRTADLSLFISFTCSEFLDFTRVLFLRYSKNFTVSVFHQNNLMTIFNDSESTENDLLNYDYSEGWIE